MKRQMKPLIGLVAAIMLSVTLLQAQEWSKAQLEVWNSIETAWEAWKSQDLDAFMASIHEDYQGWNANIPLPMSKGLIDQSYRFWADFSTPQYFIINPARITVSGNVAVVHYFYYVSSMSKRDEKPKMNISNGRNTEFLVKEGGKWLLLGDMTVEEDEGDD